MKEGKKNFIKREDLLEQLDRHLNWIKDCDTKTSIVLAVIGIFITIFISDSSINLLRLIFLQAFQNINFSNFLYLLFLVISFSVFISGIYFLLRVLTPRMGKEVQSFQGPNSDSLYFFEDISKNTFHQFKEKFFNRKLDEDIEDLLSQIYINASISTIKYHFYNKGIKFSFIGVASLLIFYFIGLVLLKTGGFS